MSGYIYVNDKQLDERLDRYYDKNEVNTKIDEALSGGADGEINLANYYTKGEVDGSLSGKADKADVADAVSELEADVADAVSELEVDIAKKANKATTLSGYGITDAYTMMQTDAKISEKANASAVYTKTEVDGKLATKADASDLSSAVSGLETQLGTKADKSVVEALSGMVEGFGNVATEDVVPIEKGGTGATGRITGFNNLAFLGEDVISSITEDTPSKWAALGTGYAYFKTKGLLTEQPSTWGIVVNIIKVTDIFQIWYSIAGNALMCKRAGHTGNGWYSSWVKSLDEKGGTMTGSLNVTKTGNPETAVIVTNDNGSVALSTSTYNRGIYDNGNKKWVAQSPAGSTDWTFNGNATGLTDNAITNLELARVKTNTYAGANGADKTFTFNSNPKLLTIIGYSNSNYIHATIFPHIKSNGIFYNKTTSMSCGGWGSGGYTVTENSNGTYSISIPGAYLNAASYTYYYVAIL